MSNKAPTWDDTEPVEGGSPAPEPTRLPPPPASGGEVGTDLSPSWGETTPVGGTLQGEDGSDVSGWESFGWGTTQGATFGFGEEMSALGEYGVGKVTDWFRPEDEKLYADEGYKSLRDRYRKDIERAQTANPWTFIAGDIVGSLPTAIAAEGLVAARLARGGSKVTKALSKLTPATTKLGKGIVESKKLAKPIARTVMEEALPKTAGQAARLGLEQGIMQGGLRGLGETREITDPLEVAKDVGIGVGAGGVLGAGLGAGAFKAIEKVSPVIAAGYQKFRGLFSDEVVDEAARLAQQRTTALFQEESVGLSRTKVRKDIQAAFQFDDDQADFAIALIDARGKAMGFQTADEVDAFYRATFESIQRGGDVSEEALKSVSSLKTHRGKWKRWSSKREMDPADIEGAWGEIEAWAKKFEQLAGDVAPPERTGTAVPRGAYETPDPKTTLLDPRFKGYRESGLPSPEFNTTCPKARQYGATVDLIERKIKRELSPKEMLAIGEMFRKRGEVAPCTWCYVEAGRRAFKRGVITFTDPLATAKKTGEPLSFIANPRKYPVRTMFIRKGKEIPKDLMFNPKYESDPTLMALRKEGQTYAQATSLASTQHAANATYKGNLLNQPEWLQAGYPRRGVRFNTRTDFTPGETIDYAQVMFDLALQGRKAYAYTKSFSFADIFADSNVRINMSTAVERNAAGEFVEDLANGVEWGPAIARRARSKNIGITMVARTEDEVNWALAQPWVDTIIPTHMAGVDANEAAGMAAKHFSPERIKAIWKKHPNYFKLVDDVRSPNTQKPVQMKINWKAADVALEQYVESGGYAGAVRANKEIADSVVKNIRKGKPVLGSKQNGRMLGSADFNEVDQATIRAFEGANFETFVHEIGHVFRRTLDADLLARASKALRVDLGVWDRELVGDAPWRKAEEAWTEGFVKYVRTGEAPTFELAETFSRMRTWMLDVYQAVRGKKGGERINPKLREIFDEMLGQAKPGRGVGEIPEALRSDKVFAGLGKKNPRWVAYLRENWERIKNTPSLDPEAGENSIPFRFQEVWDDFVGSLDEQEDRIVDLLEESGVTFSTKELWNRIDDLVAKREGTPSSIGETLEAARKRLAGYKARSIEQGLVEKKYSTTYDRAGRPRKKFKGYEHSDLDAHGIREIVQVLRKDNSAWKKLFMGKDLTDAEIAVMELSEWLSNKLKDAVGPEYRAEMAKYAHMVNVKVRMAKQLNTKTSNFQNRIKKPIQDVVLGGYGHIKVRPEDPSWYQTIIDFGKATGIDWETMIKDRLIYSQVFPDKTLPGDMPTLTATASEAFKSIVTHNPIGHVISLGKAVAKGATDPRAKSKVLYSYVSGGGPRSWTYKAYNTGKEAVKSGVAIPLILGKRAASTGAGAAVRDRGDFVRKYILQQREQKRTWEKQQQK